MQIINDGTKFRVHDLRHVYSQNLLNKGVGLEDIQWLLGHQDVTTTQKRYAQYARPDLLEKVSILDNVIDLNECLTVQKSCKINNFSQSTIIDHEKTLMQ